MERFLFGEQPLHAKVVPRLGMAQIIAMLFNVEDAHLIHSVVYLGHVQIPGWFCSTLGTHTGRVRDVPRWDAR